MASSDTAPPPAPKGRSRPASWNRCATLGGLRLELGVREPWTWKSAGPSSSFSCKEKRGVMIPISQRRTLRLWGGRVVPSVPWTRRGRTRLSTSVSRLLALNRVCDSTSICTWVWERGAVRGLRGRESDRTRLTPGSAVHLRGSVTACLCFLFCEIGVLK